jgi:hypothetical protein
MFVFLVIQIVGNYVVRMLHQAHSQIAKAGSAPGTQKGEKI